MLEQLVIEIIQSVIIGLWSVLWIECFVAPGTILSFLPRWYIQSFARLENTPSWSYDLAKPLFECAVCHAGWFTIFSKVAQAEFFSYYTFLAVVVSMITALFVTKWVN